MNTITDRILIVENNPEISEFLAEQALSNSNYQIFRVADASIAINKAKQINPDLIIANLNLPGLSGKDLLVALSSRGLPPPDDCDRNRKPGTGNHSSFPFRRS